MIGMAFVEYESEDSCAAAVTKFHGREFDGRAMRVDRSSSRSDGNISAK